MVNKIQIIIQWQKRGFISPRYLKITSTHLCNLRYIFYSHTVTNSFSNFELAYETWIKIIEESYELRIPFIDIGGPAV